MKPVELKVHNFRNLEDATVHYKDGVMGFIGGNGTGKTTLVTLAPYFAISGLIGDSEITTKKSMIKDIAQNPKRKGWATLKFEHGGETYEITRNLHDAGCGVKCLSNETFEPLSGNETVNGFMEAVLGAPFPVFFNTCWAPQEGITSIITMKHAERVRYFQKVFGVGSTDKSSRMLLDYGKNLVEYPDRTQDIKDCEDKIAESDKAITNAEMDLKNVDDQIATLEAEESSMQELLSKISKSEYDRRTVQAASALKLAEDTLQNFEASQNLQPLEEKEPCSQEDIDKYNAHLRMAPLLDKLGDLKAQLESLVQPPPIQDIGLWEGPLKQAATNLQTFEPKYKMATEPNCPTCGKPHDEAVPEAERQQVMATYQKLKEKVDELQMQRNDAYKAIQMQQSDMNSYQARKHSLESQYTQAESEHAVMPNLTGFDPEAHMKKYEEYSEYMRQVQKRQSVQNQLAEYQKAVTLRKAEHEAAVSTAYRTPDQEQKIQDVQGKLSAARQQKTHTTAQLATIKADRKNAGDLIVRFQEEQAKRRKNNKLKDIITKVRDALHPDSLPKLVMSTALHNLNRYIERYMQIFDTNFIARLDENFDWVYDTLEDQDADAKSRLSGGQKVLVGLSFRFALSDLMTKSVCMLTLDEPTNHLDAANRSKLCEVMDIVRESAEKGQVVMISTHESVLEDRCTSVIDVTKM